MSIITINSLTIRNNHNMDCEKYTSMREIPNSSLFSGVKSMQYIEVVCISVADPVLFKILLTLSQQHTRLTC